MPPQKQQNDTEQKQSGNDYYRTMHALSPATGRVHKIFTENTQIRLAFSYALGYYIAVSTQTKRVLNHKIIDICGAVRGLNNSLEDLL